MKRTTISKLTVLAVMLLNANAWGQGTGAASGRPAASGSEERDRWIRISVDQIRRAQNGPAPAGPKAEPVPVTASEMNSPATSQSVLRPSVRPEAMAAAVSEALTDAMRAETARRSQQAKYLRHVLLASNSSLDALMILEMIQNRGTGEELYKDVPLAKESATTPAPGNVVRDPKVQRIFELYEKENYRAAAEEGYPLLAEFPQDTRLRLIVANSLAWSTTRYQDAIDAYKPLLGTAEDRDGSLGLANVYRWSGREDLALPIYKKLIAQAPDNKDVREGITLTERAMRPRTLVSLGTASDTNNMRRQELTVGHRWRSPSGSGIFEIEAGGTNDTQPDLASYQRNITLRYQGLDLPLQPTFELTEQTGPQQTIYGGVNLKITDDTQLIANRVNWGLLSFNTAAELANLSAYHVALATSKTGELGNMRVRVDYFGVSDGNSVVIGNVQYTPPWRPLGEYFKPYVGISTRDQSNYSPLYWSPMNGGYGVFFGGLQAEWSNATSSLFASGQLGSGLYGEGGFNWGVSLGGRTWLNDDYAIGAKVNKYAGGQYGPSYSFTSAMVTLERAW